jgi:hypothetical protein
MAGLRPKESRPPNPHFGFRQLRRQASLWVKQHFGWIFTTTGHQVGRSSPKTTRRGWATKRPIPLKSGRVFAWGRRPCRSLLEGATATAIPCRSCGQGRFGGRKLRSSARDPYGHASVFPFYLSVDATLKMISARLLHALSLSLAKGVPVIALPPGLGFPSNLDPSSNVYRRSGDKRTGIGFSRKSSVVGIMSGGVRDTR